VTSHGLCPNCGGLKRLDEAGVLVFHHYRLDISRRAVKMVGQGRIKRRCPGSGQPPRRVER
jgi:hypothetical protein